jgi:two-component system chemotaxis sensor kinase CheA
VRRLERNEVVAYRGRAVPLVRLGAIFGLRSDGRARLHAFIVGSGLDTVAIAVDRIVGQREIVVRTVSDPLLRIDGVSGATELGDGRAVLILDIGALSRRARLGPTEGGRPGDGRVAAAAPARSANRGAPA